MVATQNSPPHDLEETTPKASSSDNPAQEAYVKTVDAVTEQVAIGLKKNGSIVQLAALANVEMNAPQNDAEYRRIANEIIENRQFTIKDVNGDTKAVKISDVDKSLEKLKEANPEEHKKAIAGLGANSLDEAIPDAKKREQIGVAVGKAVQDNSNVGFMDMIMGIISWVLGGFQGSFQDNIAEKKTNSIVNATEKNLEGLNLTAENTKDITNGVKLAIAEKRGTDTSQLEKPPTLAETKFAKAPDPSENISSAAETQQKATSQQASKDSHDPTHNTNEEPPARNDATPKTPAITAATASIAAAALSKKPAETAKTTNTTTNDKTQSTTNDIKLKDQKIIEGIKKQNFKREQEKDIPNQEQETPIRTNITKKEKETDTQQNTPPPAPNANLNKAMEKIARNVMSGGGKRSVDPTELKNATKTLSNIVKENKGLLNNPARLAKTTADKLLNPDANDYAALETAKGIRSYALTQGGINDALIKPPLRETIRENLTPAASELRSAIAKDTANSSVSFVNVGVTNQSAPPLAMRTSIESNAGIR